MLKRSMSKAKYPRYRLYTVLLLIAYLLPAIPPVKAYFVGLELFLSLYWVALTVIVWRVLPGILSPGNVHTRTEMCEAGFAGAFIIVALYYLVGVIFKQLKGSPYDNSPVGFLRNVLILFPPIVARESIRAYGMATIWKYAKKKRQFFTIIFLLIIAIGMANFPKLKQLTSNKDIFIYVAKDVLPIIADNALCCVLVLWGGKWAGIFYAALVAAFWRFFPFLPDISWFAYAVIGVAFPCICATFMYGRGENSGKKKLQEVVDISWKDFVGLGLIVLMAWFWVGVFPVRPLVILTGSMEPKIMPGDVVLIEKMQKEEDIQKLSEGDIINFDRDDKINITHRIKKVKIDENGNRTFITKGDNNKSEDSQEVDPNDIRGIVHHWIPKIGLPMLMLKAKNDVPEGVVDEQK